MKRIRFLAMSLALPLLSSCSGWVSIGNYEDADKYLSGNQTYTGALTAIDVDWVLGSVTLVSDSSIDGVKVEEDNQLVPEQKVHSYFDNGTLRVKFFASGLQVQGLNHKDKQLILTYNPSAIETFSVSVTSGTIAAPILSAKESVFLEVTSGTAKVEGVETKKVQAHLTSGKIEIAKLQADEVMVNGTSGNLRFAQIETPSFSAKMTSGTQDYSFLSLGTGKIDFTSGSLRVKLPQTGAAVKVSKTSGSIVTERECVISGNVYRFGDGSSSLDISLTSGMVTLS